jgi:DNA transposition AAA+ family ATPase
MAQNSTGGTAPASAQIPRGAGTLAPLTNVAALLEAVEDTLGRSGGLPGLVCMYGRPGLGKSSAAAYVTAKHRAVYIEMKSVWSAKFTLGQILEVMGIPPDRSVSEMLNQVCEELSKSRRPLIIDQADYLVDKGRGQLIMDLYEGSLAPVVVIGEERLPANLKRHNRTVHDRVLRWCPAQPASADDVQTLALAYCRGLTIAPELLATIRAESEGVTRWIAVTLHRIAREARVRGWQQVDAATWGRRDLRTGELAGAGG